MQQDGTYRVSHNYSYTMFCLHFLATIPFSHALVTSFFHFTHSLPLYLLQLFSPRYTHCSFVLQIELLDFRIICVAYFGVFALQVTMTIEIGVMCFYLFRLTHISIVTPLTRFWSDTKNILILVLVGVSIAKIRSTEFFSGYEG